MAYKTPGVYVQEIALFPPSVAEVATAIPAFIGYTEMAITSEGKSLDNEPTRIKSLKEYESLFGYGYVAETITVTVKAASKKSIVGVSPDKRFLLYDSLRQYFDNGGGPCYIVSVGSYTDTISYQPISDGIELLRDYDEPTLILFPDAVQLLDGSNKPDIVKFSQLQNQSLALCASMQDRFCIFDLLQGDQPEGTSIKPITDFRNKTGVNYLNYGAAYYPWIVTSYTVDVDLRQLVFQDDAAVPAPVSNSDAAFSKNTTETALITAVKNTITETDLVLSQVTLSAAEKKSVAVGGAAVLTTILRDRLNALYNDIQKGTTTDAKLEEYANTLKNLAISFATVEGSASLSVSSKLRTDLSNMKADATLTDAIGMLVSVEKNTLVVDNMPGARTDVIVKGLYSAVDGPVWLAPFVDYDDVTANATVFANTDAGRLAIIDLLASNEVTSTLLTYFGDMLNAAMFYEEQAELALWTGHAFYAGVSNAVTLEMQTMPPSGAVAGIYAYVDGTRGVWKAPANVSLNNVIGPAVKIDNIDQDNMNVTDTGKSINAIRAFAGKGTLVWGARTLAGNDNEWRYVPVRRFFIMVEESVKKATFQFVFEPNDANTWTKLRVMVQNFLTLQWRAGALQGAKPEDAFFVNVGLDETMTSLDILEGRLIVEIGMAVVRPAEFIILRFTHLMQDK
jgi:phage tail sheath protein FI